MSADEPARVCALVVTYQPDPDLLRRVLRALVSQVGLILVVDNASQHSPERILNTLPGAPVQLLRLESNQGLAGAQNHGIEWIRRHAFSHLILFDQDSLAEPDMVARLLDALTDLTRGGVPVAAVGPAYVDPRTGDIRPFVRFPGLTVQRQGCNRPGDRVRADFLIASGTLIPLRRLAEIGLFESDLFIDNVDLEWCFRAIDQGYRLYGICDARMLHQLGDQAVRVWLGRWWHVYRHGPLRQYYMARNRISLYRRRYSPRGWILQDLLRFPVKLIWFGLVFGPRLRNLRMILRGTLDGLRGRLGPYR